jgi:shikimate kinase
MQIYKTGFTMPIIFEGKHDKNTYKAIFLAGPPASGKTEFYKYAISGKNLKHLDSDKVMTFLAKREGRDLKDTSNYDDFHKRTYEILNQMNKSYTSGGLGLVVDGTGHNTSKYLGIKEKLERKGYKTMMVFVNIPIEKSIAYSKTRDRGVDTSYIKRVAEKLKKNFEVYKKSFTYFVEVEGMNDESYDAGRKAVDAFLRA